MDNFFSAVRDMFPVRTEWLVGTIGAGMTYLFGPWNDILATLIVFMIFDYFTGIFAAYINPNLALNSEKGFKGILKKIMILLLVALAHCLDRILGQSIIMEAVTGFFIANEGLSILENSAKAGLPIPQKLKNALEQLTNEKTRKKG